MQNLLHLRVLQKDTSHHQLIQQALQLLQEDLATKYNSNTQRPEKRAGKGGGKDDEDIWLLYWTYVIIFIVIFFMVWCNMYIFYVTLRRFFILLLSFCVHQLFKQHPPINLTMMISSIDS